MKVQIKFPTELISEPSNFLQSVRDRTVPVFVLNQPTSSATSVSLWGAQTKCAVPPDN